MKTRKVISLKTVMSFSLIVILLTSACAQSGSNAKTKTDDTLAAKSLADKPKIDIQTAVLEVTDTRLICLQQAMSDAGLVHFDSDVIPVRVFGGLLHQCFAVSETNFHNSWRLSAEHCVEVQLCRRELDSERRPQCFERLLL